MRSIRSPSDEIFLTPPLQLLAMDELQNDSYVPRKGSYTILANSKNYTGGRVRIWQNRKNQFAANAHHLLQIKMLVQPC